MKRICEKSGHERIGADISPEQIAPEEFEVLYYAALAVLEKE